MQSMIETECKCFHPLFLDSDKMRNGLDPCTLREQSPDFTCVLDIMHRLDNAEKNCSCFVNCEEIGYKTEFSLSKFPSLQYEVNLFLEFTGRTLFFSYAL